MRDLRPGSEYSVCLQIRAGELTGAASEAATFRAPPAPPAAPAAPRVHSRARSSLLLRWPAVAEHGARVTHYVLQAAAGDEPLADIAQPHARQHAAAGLRAQTRYRFRVAAVNERGRGPWSEETVAWTAGAPPPAPPPPELQRASPTSLALAWHRRAADDEYTLQMDDRAAGHGFLPVYSGRDATHVCEGLRRATEYRFRLRCETADGRGPWSAEVAYRTTPERPGAPGRPAARGKPKPRALRLEWDAPADDGGATVDSYLLELDDGDGYAEAYRGRETEALCDRLRPGTPYRARVRCSNEAGVGEWSATATIATEATRPGACDAPEPVGEPRATSAAFRWRPPDSTGGAAVTEYRLEAIDSAGDARLVYSGAAAECVVRDLSPGREYRVRVSACNRVGVGAPSEPLSFSTVAAPPDAPGAPTAILESPRSARLEWEPPRDNGAPIIDYRLEMSSSDVDDAFAEVYRGVENRCVVNDLAPFSPYFFRVYATNSAGRGCRSTTTNALTPRAPPAAPTALRYEATVDSLALSWRAPADRGAEILRYRIEIDRSETETDGPTTEFTIGNLVADACYRVRVAAVSELGVGDWSEVARASTRPPPPSPPPLECVQRAPNFLKLKWGDGVAADGALYCLEMRAPDSREFRPAYRGSARSCKVKKLREETEYAFRIRASDSRGGRGPASDELRATTLPAPPPPPRAPTLEAAGARAAVARWEPPPPGHSVVVQCARGRDSFRRVYAGDAASCALSELDAGAEYTVRVCRVRDGLAGAWSGGARLLVPTPAAAETGIATATVAISTTTTTTRRRTRSRRLEPRHAALLLAGGFLVLALAVAVLVQRLVETRG